MKMLFQLPAPRRIEPTLAQLRLLDELALRGGVLRALNTQTARVLRRLIEQELVRVQCGAPAHYTLTGVGAMVRLRCRGSRET